MIGMMAAGAFMLIALLSFYSGDPSFLNSGAGGAIKNSGGRFGAELAGLLIGVFGDLAYLFPLLIIYRAIRVFREKLPPQWNWPMFTLRTIGFFLVMFAGSAIAHIHFSHAHFDISKMTKPLSAGGFIGEGLGHFSLNSFGLTGATLVLLASFLIGLTVFTDLSWFKLMDATGAWTLRAIEWLQQKYLQWRESKKEQEIFVQAKEERKQTLVKEEKKIVNRTPPKIEKPAPQVVKSERVEKERQKKLFDEPVTGELPPISLLDPPEQDKKRGYSEEALSGMSRLLEIKLKDFGVDAEVVAVMPGPVVTRFEIQPAAGVKVSRITNLAKDLARSLAVVSVRVVEVIPGKTVVGIEIPNEQREMIRFSEVLASKDFDDALSPLTLALGKDIAGQPVVADLQKMPHLLVAGTT
ncbi:MAG TPA: DNA translocase FtsK 4TM domain-containing protein, partial [Pseudomonadales bacterium]|nr:DNA translocase FtsK 4TM domain-containing protein [Pseudomonadales bacterium]